MVHVAAIDVLMTVYNGARYVRAAVESLQSQSFQDICIHIVDDGSTDDTPDILAEIAAGDPRIQVYTKPNGGVVDAANYGLARCSAEFVARLDADDIAYPDRLERQIGYLRDHPDVSAISGAARHIGPEGERLGTTASFPPPEGADPGHVPAIEPYLLHPFLAVRRSAIVRVGGYRKLSVSEDSDLYWRLQEVGRLVNDPHFYGEYRMHPGSISSQSIQGGRVMAVYSQLVALSAARRRSGQVDIDFTSGFDVTPTEVGGSLEAICLAASAQLSSSEREHLRFASAVKLLEMAGYRPYELDFSDCKFIRRAFEESGASLRPENKSLVRRMYSGTAARLAAKGDRTGARALLLPGATLSFWMKLAVRTALSPSVHGRFRHMFNPIIRWARGS